MRWEDMPESEKGRIEDRRGETRPRGQTMREMAEEDRQRGGQALSPPDPNLDQSLPRSLGLDDVGSAPRRASTSSGLSLLLSILSFVASLLRGRAR